MKEEIAGWRTQMGFDYIKRPDEDRLRQAFEISSSMLDNMSLADLDDVILVLSNYYVFLGSEVGRLSARARYLSDEIGDKISKRSAKMEGGTAMERRALIVSQDENLSSLNQKLLLARGKHEMLIPIYDSIKVKIDSVKRVYFRRTSEAKN